MPARKAGQKDKQERIRSLCQDYADSLFGGNIERGFLYWAAKELHLEQALESPTAEDFLGNITDGKDDLEVDAFYVDEDSRTVYLFQSKYRSTPANIPHKDVVGFADAPKRLTDAPTLARNSNAKLLEFAPVFREKMLAGYQLELVYLTTLYATQPIQGRANSWSAQPLVLDIAGAQVAVAHSLVVSDADELISKLDSLAAKAVRVPLKFSDKAWHVVPTGQFKCLVATMHAKELATIFHQYRFAIFRHNPRGPLGATAVNRKIKATLADGVQRPNFHLFNNGLSAVCTAFTDPSANGHGVATTHVTDFQIVNGCQTTYQIWDHWRRGGSLDNTYVVLKLVEGESLRHFISEYSNYQSQMKDWDFLFNDPVQTQLQKGFAQLPTPLFYELRRGEYQYMEQSPAKRVTVKDITQYGWSFLGHPAEAKDKLRDVPRTRGQSGPYQEVFFSGVTADHLYLPWLVYHKVQKEYEKYYSASQIGGDFREYGRLHLVALIGRGLLALLNGGSYAQLGGAQARRLAQTIDSWFDRLHSLAVEALRYVKDVEEGTAEETGKPFSLRELFRSTAKYPKFEKRYLELLTPLQQDHSFRLLAE